jgi:hypothetical protein
MADRTAEPLSILGRSSTGMVLLERLNGQTFGLNGTHRPDTGLDAANGGEDWNTAFHRGTANLNFVLPGSLATWRVDDEIDFVILHHVDHVRPSFAQFEKSMDS